MKIIFNLTIYIFYLCSILQTNAQTFSKLSGYQDVNNINCIEARPRYLSKDMNRAVFRFSTGSGGFTGTMINQFYDADSKLRQMFISINQVIKLLWIVREVTLPIEGAELTTEFRFKPKK